MISSLTLINQGKRISKKYAHAHDIPFLLANTTIDFQPGINIIFGPNGSGKSTIIDLCAGLLLAKQAGRTVVTREAITDIHGMLGDELPPAMIAHDGKPILHVDPRRAVGLKHGHFDDDFLIEAICSLRNDDRSSGQLSSLRIAGAVEIIMRDGQRKKTAKSDRETSISSSKRKKPPASKQFSRESSQEAAAAFPDDVEWKIAKDNGAFSVKRAKLAEALLAPTIGAGQRTILMDEPEAGFSLVWQAGFWQNVMSSKQAAGFQIIVSSHSPFALNVPGAHYIETESGYIDACRKLFAGGSKASGPC